MTTDQIAYFKAKEDQRHNRAMEAYNEHNLDELVRHNVQTEVNDIYKARLGYAGSVYSADRHYGASVYSADSQRASAKYTADTNAATQRYVANTNSATQRYVADRNYRASIYSADKRYEASVMQTLATEREHRRNRELEAEVANEQLNLDWDIARYTENQKFLRLISEHEFQGTQNALYRDLDRLKTQYNGETSIYNTMIAGRNQTSNTILSVLGQAIPNLSIKFGDSYGYKNNGFGKFNTPKIK